MKAILVGINEYLRSPQDMLRGCVNDSNNIGNLLDHKMDWDDLDIKFLLNSQATAAYEKELVLDMINSAKDGDHLVWSHSSHGSNNPEPSQKDGLEEVLCSYDIAEKDGMWDYNTVISAKWIGSAIIQLRPKATLDILLDCCHAPEGSQLKQLGLSYSRAKFMPRLVAKIMVNAQHGEIQRTKMPDNVALWSACQPDQYSADAYIDNSWQGAFTAAFLMHWTAKRSRNDIIHYSRLWLKQSGYDQTPHLYCCPELATAKPFGVT